MATKQVKKPVYPPHVYGEALYRLRMAAGVSQNDLGRALGHSQNMISRWESGESPITREGREPAQTGRMDKRMEEGNHP